MKKKQINKLKKHGTHFLLSNLIILSAAFIISFIFLTKTNLFRPVNFYDEGVVAYGSELVSDGSVPYRDFWTIYAPAQYYCTALMFKVFGTSLTTMRLWDILLRTLMVMVIFVIARRIFGIFPAFVSCLTALIWLGYLQWNGYPGIPAVLFCIISLEFLRLFTEKGNREYLLLAGISCGITTLFRLDFGIYTLAAVLASAAVTSSFKFIKNHTGFKEILDFFYGFFAVVVVPALYFLFVAGPGELYYDLFRFPVFILPAYRHLDFPNVFTNNFDAIQDYFPYYYPFIIYGALVLFIVMSIAAKKALKNEKESSAAVLPALFAGLLFFIQLKSRTDYCHLEPFIFLAILLQGYLYVRLYRLRKGFNYGLLALLAAANILALVVTVNPITGELKRGMPEISGLKRAGRIGLNGEMYNAILYIRSKTQKGDYIFCGNTSHNRVIGNDVLSYFLAERKSATKYFTLDPGSADTPEVQKHMVADLISHNVKYTILFSGFEDANEPNKSAKSGGSCELDSYIKENFKEIWSSDPEHLFHVMERE